MSISKQGSKAPNFNLKDQSGKSHKLGDYKGKIVVLYFYPKDDTPGCTIEAKEFRDDFNKFKKKKIEIFGISPDSEESHKKFCSKYKLPFTLLADV
ncbi:MAG: peroxiredoxin, partial [Candidatus Nanoarchaeia archaeon]